MEPVAIYEPLAGDEEMDVGTEEVPEEEDTSEESSVSNRRCALLGIYMLLCVQVLAYIFDFCPCEIISAVQKKINPFHHMKHGKVNYLVEVTDEGRIYHRDMYAPCAYGILVFQVAPALEAMSYSLEVYNDEFTYRDNSGLCAFKPNYQHGWTSDVPYITDKDPTLVLSKFNYVTRMSSKQMSPPPQGTKKLDPGFMEEYAGDYFVVARGRFYTADVYHQILDIVHNWEPDQPNEGTLQDALEAVFRDD